MFGCDNPPFISINNFIKIYDYTYEADKWADFIE